MQEEFDYFVQEFERAGWGGALDNCSAFSLVSKARGADTAPCSLFALNHHQCHLPAHGLHSRLFAGSLLPKRLPTRQPWLCSSPPQCVWMWISVAALISRLVYSHRY